MIGGTSTNPSPGLRATENHHAQTRRETGEEQARRLVAAELDRLGWTEADLAGRAKGDPQKISIAQRLRAETTVTLKWIAAELHMGTWTHVANRLQHAKKQAAPEQQNEIKLL